jgi:hypothetical protein
MQPNTNQREFTRVKVRLDADVYDANHTLIAAGRTADVSLKGLFLPCSVAVGHNAPCAIVLHLDGRLGKVKIRSQGSIVRVSAHGIGVQFSGMDLESFLHLKNVVLYNCQDTAVVESEFRAHLGLKPKPVSDTVARFYSAVIQPKPQRT